MVNPLSGPLGSFSNHTAYPLGSAAAAQSYRAKTETDTESLSSLGASHL